MPDGVKKLATKHKSTFEQLIRLEETLISRFPGLDRAAAALVLAVATGEALLLIGPPGTAKSRLIRVFCHETGLIDDAELTDPAARDQVKVVRGQVAKAVPRNENYFEYLLTAFTEPGELFGFFDLGKLQEKHVLEREQRAMMQQARVVFLDEVFNASSAILNSLLAFMNERKFHDRGDSIPVRMEQLFAATNRVPNTPELRALFDRFLLRCWVDNAAAERAAMAEMITAGWKETHGAPLHKGRPPFGTLLDDVLELRKDIEESSRNNTLVVDTESEFFAQLADLKKMVAESGLSDLSNRRLVRFAKVALVNACLRSFRGADGRRPLPAVNAADLQTILDFGLDQQAPTNLQARFVNSL